MGGESKRRREAIARGEPDPGRKGLKNPGRRNHKLADELRAAARKTRHAAGLPPNEPPK
jgi:hypothetical protein